MLYHKMSLNPDSVCMEGPSAKLSFTINAFNGNTTNFRPSPKSFVSVPAQPRGELPIRSTLPPRTIMPM